MLSEEEHLTLYLWEIEEQCRYALKAWEQIQSPDADINTEPWYSIQAFLVAVANISKFLWPTDKNAEKRGEQLREELLIQDNHPFKRRKMRDHFEHFDERLDSWIASGKGYHLGRTEVVAGPDLFKSSSEDIDRHYVRDTGQLTFFGEEYDLKWAANEIDRLYKLVRGKGTTLLMK